ncbi:pyridoxamine 5'-phosphate oxidase family protein [Mycobacterium camsae]|uniref:pyridoxamine 5'-phosphate oxidase family protein n=1 Tax=Mycobacterium gordonae TaxID=1778 RepID=UPI00197CDD08|nr:pyridoxamine 5'-phosphate oxidase family protein [Mycobacterium gordonae]
MTITPRNLDGYGTPPIEWDSVKAVLDSPLPQAPGTGGPQRHTTWLTTVNRDGSPHVMAVGVQSVNGIWYFTSGPATRKSRNLMRDPRCTFSVATEPFDLVIEGVAERVTGRDELASLAAEYAADGWPAEVAGDALTAPFSAPSAGPAPWHLYRVRPATVFALGTAEPFGATKFELD